MVVSAPPPTREMPDAGVIDDARKRQRRRRGRAAAITLAALLAGVAAIVGGGSGGGRGSSLPSAGGAWSSAGVGHGISVSYPSGWHVFGPPLTSLSYPYDRMLLTSYPAATGGDCSPTRAEQALPLHGQGTGALPPSPLRPAAGPHRPVPDREPRRGGRARGRAAAVTHRRWLSSHPTFSRRALGVGGPSILEGPTKTPTEPSRGLARVRARPRCPNASCAGCFTRCTSAGATAWSRRGRSRARSLGRPPARPPHLNPFLNNSIRISLSSRGN
jgi:hypothetical protein